MSTDTKNLTILGAGITGLMIAYTLADDYQITIYDPKGFPADNASLMAGGMLAPYAEIEHMDMAWVKAGIKGIEIWKNINLDTGLSQEGSLLVAHPEDRYILERFKSHLPADYQTPQNVKNHEEQLSQTFQNGLFLKEEAHLDPHKAIPSFCNFLQHHPNVTLIAEAKEPDTSELTVDCRGMDANDKSLRGVKGETLTVCNTDFALKRPVRLMHPRYPLYIIPREGHIFMIGATIIESADSENVSLRSGMELMSALYSLHPSFADAEIIRMKAGIRPSYSDNLPRIKVNDNKISANGSFRHGFLLAPIIASCVKDYLNGTDNEFSPLLMKGKDNENNHQRAA